ncbi:MAG TPA: head GIN domain-containing protein [Povalibacter sp.]|nr:head GIN domain-containing protein [Povalibacter sp.]
MNRPLNLRPRVSVLAAAVLLLSACGDSSVQTGPMRNETRPVGDFDSVQVEGAARLEVTVGVPVSLQVEGRDLFVKRLETEVRDNTLHIKSTRKDWITIGTSPRLTIRIGVPKLALLSLQGGNDARLTGFDGGSTTIRVEGATNLRAEGRLDELTVFMAGAGHANLDNLIARSANVTVAGVGNVTVHPEESLDATMNGVGAIFYSGNPRDVSTHVNGLGTIGHRKDGPSPQNEDKPVDPNSLQPEYEESEKPEAQQTTGVI